jgi:hypothetical protein
MKIKRLSSPIAATTVPQLEEVLALPNARLVEVPLDGCAQLLTAFRPSQAIIDADRIVAAVAPRPCGAQD